MARRGGRRGRRRGRRGSTRSKASSSKSKKSKSRRRSTAASKRRRVRSVAKAKRAANRSPSKSKTTKKKSRKPMGRSRHTKGGQHKANKNQNKKARRTVRSVKKAVSRVAKGIGKSLRGAAANAAGITGRPKSKLQQQLSNLRKDIAQKSTKEARFQRRRDRLRNQFGLDYSQMNPSFKANVNVSQAYRHLGLDKNRITRSIYNSLPKAVRNFSWKHQFKAPTKLGISDGYRSPNRGGSDIVAGGLPRPIRGLPPRGPERDWLGDFYRRYNIGGKGGNLDQEARDYWSNEAKTKGRTAVLDIIRGTARNQGTWGGMSAEDEARIAKIPKGSRTNYKGTIIDRRSSRFRSPKRKRRMAKSIAAHMAAKSMGI